MADRLKDKVALVTGAGSIGPGWGNGKATSVLFAREGAKIVCADLNLEAAEETAGIIQAEGGEAIALKCDVASAKDVDRVVSEAVKRWGRAALRSIYEIRDRIRRACDEFIEGTGGSDGGQAQG